MHTMHFKEAPVKAGSEQDREETASGCGHRTLSSLTTESGLKSTLCAADHAPVLSGGKGPAPAFLNFLFCDYFKCAENLQDSTENSRIL